MRSFHTTAGKKRTVVSLIILSAFVTLILVLFYSMARDGADFIQYMEWARSIKENNIFFLSGNVESPMGVPLTQWSFGPGMIFLLGYFLFPDINSGALFMGWVFTIILWGALFGIFYHASRRDVFLTVFGLLITFVGTHLGFYSTVYSSESLSYCCFAVMVYWVMKTKKWLTVDSLMVGILSGLLIVIRSQLIIYCVPVLGAMVFSIHKNTEQESRAKKLLLFFLSLFPILLAILEVGFNNRWMTGSFTASPYAFGTGTFKSIDWMHPELLAVISHSWHGLLSYHPLYAIGLFALVLLMLRKRKISEKIFYASLLLVILVHLYLHASWYVWWLGTWTFGMRGLGLAAIILIPCLIHFMALSERRGLRYQMWFIFILMLCFWSFLLMIQNNQVYTQFYTYGMLLKAQWSQLLSLFSPESMASLAVFILAAFLTLKKPKEGYHPLPYMTVLFLFFMAVFSLLGHYTFFSGSEKWNNHFFTAAGKYVLKHQDLISRNPFIVFIILLALLGFAAVALNRLLSLERDPTRSRYFSLVMTVFFIGVFTATNILFIRFTISTEKMLGSADKPSRIFHYRSTVDIDEVEASYREYLRVPDFTDKKEALKDYLESLKQTSKITE